jgi:hypothetical protein
MLSWNGFVGFDGSDERSWAGGDGFFSCFASDMMNWSKSDDHHSKAPCYSQTVDMSVLYHRSY